MTWRTSEPDTFGEVKKIDAPPETITQAILSRVGKKAKVDSLTRTNDGKPLIDTGSKEVEMQVLREQEEELERIKREKVKAKVKPRRAL